MACHLVATCYTCKNNREIFSINARYENLCILGDVEITIYHDGTYGISKEAVPIFINDLLSLKKLITIFYGTPFNLNFEKIRCVNFNRYCVSIPEIYVEKFEVAAYMK